MKNFGYKACAIILCLIGFASVPGRAEETAPAQQKSQQDSFPLPQVYKNLKLTAQQDDQLSRTFQAWQKQKRLDQQEKLKRAHSISEAQKQENPDMGMIKTTAAEIGTLTANESIKSIEYFNTLWTTLTADQRKILAAHMAEFTGYQRMSPPAKPKLSPQEIEKRVDEFTANEKITIEKAYAPLGLTQQQKDLLLKHRQEMIRHMLAQQAEQAEALEVVRDAQEQENPDMAEVKAAAARLGETEAQRFIAGVEYSNDFQSILTPEQMKIFKAHSELLFPWSHYPKSGGKTLSSH